MERDINRLRQEFSEGIQNIVDDFSHRLERLNPEYHRRKEREQRMTALTILLGILIGGALLAWRSLSQPTQQNYNDQGAPSDYDEGR